MDGQIVELSNLPSRGYSYPDDIEIYVKPLSIKEQIDMERYGITDAEYFNILLNGITIKGSFNKNNLLQSDVNFLDLVRRLYSFDLANKITIKDVECDYKDCEGKIDYEFSMEDIEFTDFNEDIFGKHFIFGEGTEDELEVVVSPITVGEYLPMSRYFRNIKSKKGSLSDMYTEYMCLCIRDIIGREFKGKKDRDAFLKDYIGNLYSAKDKKVLKQIAEETTVKVKPFIAICDECGRETEVQVLPTSNFQQ